MAIDGSLLTHFKQLVDKSLTPILLELFDNDPLGRSLLSSTGHMRTCYLLQFSVGLFDSLLYGKPFGLLQMGDYFLRHIRNNILVYHSFGNAGEKVSGIFNFFI